MMGSENTDTNLAGVLVIIVVDDDDVTVLLSATGTDLHLYHNNLFKTKNLNY